MYFHPAIASGEFDLTHRALRIMFVLLSLLSVGLVFPQDEAGVTLDIIGIDSTDLSQVAIHTSVLDTSGQLVSGLGVEHFSIGGDLASFAQVTKVENVSDDDLAFASVLVIDTSSSMAEDPIWKAQAAARDYIMALEDDDPVALLIFNNDVQTVVDYSTNRSMLLEAVDNLAYGGRTALYDATLRGIEVATKAPLPRKAVIILSDGGEYGNVSQYDREESIRAATIHGVPVYSIGLGWHIDRRFLEAISAESNAQFYNSPTPEELGDIYSHLAYLFRSQYIVTISADVPGDGKRYDFTLNVRTDDGETAAGSATLRAPIPVPLLFLPDDLFIEALREDTEIQVQIEADQDIDSIEYALDGEVVSTEESYTIEPVRNLPGEHQLDITVSDVEGDVGRLRADFEIAALPPTVSDDFETVSGEAIGEVEAISVEAGGQTEITQVEFIIDGEVVKTDSEAPYNFELDPFALLPEQHRLSIRVSNIGGETTTVEEIFEIEALPPRIEIVGSPEETLVSDRLSFSVEVAGQSPIVSLTSEPDISRLVDGDTLEFDMAAVDLPPGSNSITVRAVDAAGMEASETIEFEVVPLPPMVELRGLEIDALIDGPQEIVIEAGGQTDITQVEFVIDEEVVKTDSEAPYDFELDPLALSPGQHSLSIRVSNTGGETTTVEQSFEVETLPPQIEIAGLPEETVVSDRLSFSVEVAGQSPIVSLSSDPDIGRLVDGDTLEFDLAVVDLPPGSNSIAIRAVDEARMETNETIEFEVAPLPPTVELSGLVSDALIDGPLEVAVEAGGQTDITQVEFIIDGEVVKTDSEAPYDFELDPFALSPERHSLSIRVTNAGGETTTVEQSFEVEALPPRTEIVGLPEETVVSDRLSFSVNVAGQSPIVSLSSDPDIGTLVDEDTLEFDLAAVDLPPGSNSITIRAVDEAGMETSETIEFEVAPLPPTVELSGLVSDALIAGPQEVVIEAGGQTEISRIEVAYNNDAPELVEGGSFTIPAEELGDGEHEAQVTVSNAAGQSTTLSLPFTIDLSLAATFTAVPSEVSTETMATAVPLTDTPVSTDTPTDTSVPTDTPTDKPMPTDTPTDTPLPTDTPTDTPVPTDTPTDTPVPTDTPTDTPVPTDTPNISETVAVESSQTAVQQEATLTAESVTAEAEETEEPTELVAVDTEVPTEEALQDPTAQPTLTPVTMTEVDDPSADEPETADNTVAIAAVAVGLLLLLILFLVSRRRGQADATPEG